MQVKLLFTCIMFERMDMDTYRITYYVNRTWIFFFVNAENMVDALTFAQEALIKGHYDPAKAIMEGCSILSKERGVVCEIHKD
jgi:hypothetical protein